MKSSRALKIGAGVAIAASVALSVATTSAQAADLPSRTITPVAPFIAPAPYSWTGAYVGISAGGDFTSNRFQTTAVATGFAVDPNTSLANFNDDRFRLGGFVGYNYQFNQFVIGVEGDGAYDFGSTRRVGDIPGNTMFVATPISDSVSARSRFDASVRGRLGVTLLPTLLLYATGGVAFRDASYSASCPGGSVNSFCSQSESQSFSNTRTGYTVGGGVEAVVFRNLTARVEYRYSDFGSRNLQFFGTPNGVSGDFFSANTRLTASTVTVGLAYKFDFLAPPAPVVARY